MSKNTPTLRWFGLHNTGFGPGRTGTLLILTLGILTVAKLSYAAVDLYMHDCPSDTGVQPNPGGTCPDMWVSEDIWIRNDPIPNYSPEPYDPTAVGGGHWTMQPGVLLTQSAIYRDPKLSRPNYIYVRVRTRGTGPQTTAGKELHVYWAKAALSLAWPTQWRGPVADPDGYVATLTTPPCPNLYLGDEVTKPRRNGTMATTDQRNRFINAVNQLNTAKFYVNGAQSISYWDNQDQIHRYHPEHGNDAFNPWHRELISRFEQLLKEIDPRVTLMYWDWTTDPSSSLGFMGNFGVGAAARVGTPFAGLDNNFSCTGARNTPLTGAPNFGCSTCGVLPYDFTLPPVVICRNRNLGATPAADSVSLNLAAYPAFSIELEDNAHNWAHPRIGGTQNRPTWSPQDPIFFFIHGNNDRLWAKWQRDQTLPGHMLQRMTSAFAYGGTTFCRLPSTIQPWDGRASAWGSGCTPGRTPIFPWSGPGFQPPTITAKQYNDASVVTPPIYDNAPLTIPRLNAGEEVILQIPWYPPNPANYACFGADSGHFCLLARIEEPGQPLLGMFMAETSDVNLNTRNNNNIAWKNISIINPFASVLLRNIADVVVPTRLGFTAESIQGLNLLSYGDIFVDLGVELEARWDEGGGQSVGVERIAPGKIKLSLPDASLSNIILQSNDVFSVQIRFRFHDNYPHPGSNQFNLRMAQYGMPADPDAVVGGQHLQFDINKIRLVKAGSVWRYLDTGINPGSNWKFVGYDDSQWRSGPAELGYGNTPATVINGGQGTNLNITTYFRQQFQIERPALFRRLLLRVKHDDGAVVYLNGVEIYRSLMPQGAIDSQTSATAEVTGAREKAFIPFDVSNFLNLLQAGTNLVAVEVHQVSTNSDDLSFDLELCANAEEGGSPELPVVEFMQPVTTTYFLVGRPITLSADAFLSAGQIERVRFLDGAMEIGRVQTPPYTIIWSNAALGIHTVCAVADQLGGGSTVKLFELSVVTNLYPVVQMVNPTEHTQVAEGEPVQVAAFAADDGGQIQTVSLFVKSAESWVAVPVLVGTPSQPPYEATAAGLLAGDYVAYAEAEDNQGAVQRSGYVHFSVVAKGRLGISLSGPGEISLTLTTLAGRHYRVEYKNDLNATSWTTLQDNINGTGGDLTINDTGSQRQRFYRAVQLH